MSRAVGGTSSTAGLTGLPLFNASQPTTVSSKSSAVVMFDNVMGEQGFTMANLEKGDCCNDLFSVFAAACLLEVKANKQPYAGGTLCEYIRKVKESAKAKFPKLSYWVEGGDDYVNNLANEVEAQAKRVKNEDGDGGEENYLFRLPLQHASLLLRGPREVFGKRALPSERVE